MRDFGTNKHRMTMKQLGQWSTRLYIILFIGAFIIVTLYEISTPRTITITFNQPSFYLYNDLTYKYDHKLVCTCSSIASTYKKYTTIEPMFHEICSSQFISEEWRINFTKNLISNLSNYEIKDYRRFLSAYLQFLQGLCELFKQSVVTYINQFLDSFLITTRCLSQDDFQMRVYSNIEQIKSNSPNQLTHILYLIRHLNHRNGIISTYGTSFHIFGHFTTIGIIYDGCSCEKQHNCTSQAKFIETNPFETTPIKGLKVGCTPSESLFASTLECFYDLSCIELLQKYTNSTINIPLSVTNMKQFSFNTTDEELMNKLFIEDWHKTTNYSLYYDQCSPSSCGMAIVLKWICPKLIRILFQIYKHRKKQQNHVQSITTTQITISENISCHLESETNSSLTKQYSSKIFLKWISIVIIIITILILFSILFVKVQLTTKTISTTISTSAPITITNNITESNSTENCQLQFQLKPISNWIYSDIYGKSLVVYFNDDLRDEIVVWSGRSNEISILSEHINGDFQMRNLSLDREILTLLISDFNNDKYYDLVIGEFPDRIHVYLGKTNYTFGPSITTILIDYYYLILELKSGHDLGVNMFGPILTTDFNEDDNEDIIGIDKKQISPANLLQIT
ncbi:hypothetical protein I4U23_027581 [Adineta vaga]|nr:hypothetical protein I4U23_027581 [Adineta vaga]